MGTGKKDVVLLKPSKAIEPPAYIITHRCREWRLNVYRKWKAKNPGES